MEVSYFYIYKLLKAILLPPGLFVILFILAYFLVRRKLVSRIFLISALATYVLSLPILSILLHKVIVPRTNESFLEGDVIVVMGAGLSDESISRLVKAYEIFVKTNNPIIVSGYKDEARMMFSKLLLLGVDRRFILMDTSSRNTYENAKNVSRMLKDLGFRKPILITTDYHLRRSMYEFGKYDVQVIPVASNPRSMHVSFTSYLPSHRAFCRNMIYISEILGILGFALFR